MKRTNGLTLPLALLCLLALSSCMEQSYDDSKKERTQIASDSVDGDPIIIGVSSKSAGKDDSFINGVKLAAKELNNTGGVLDSPLEIELNDGESAYDDPQLSTAERQNAILDIANGFAANPKLIAVIGHSSSPIALLASIIYQNTGILFLSPQARYSKLTGHNFDYTFRSLLTNDNTALQMADFIADKGYKNIAILHSRDNSATELAEAFSTYAVESKDPTKAATIVFRRSFFENSVDIISLIIDLKNVQNLDAVFIAASSKLSAAIYERSRSMGVKAAFIGGENLDTNLFLNQVRQWENAKDIQKSTISTLFNETSPVGQEFIKKYRREYGPDEQPDYLAAIGYDTIFLLAHGIQLAQSTIPIEIATSLRYMEPCKGVTGVFKYQTNGDLENKPLYFKHLVKRDYVYELGKDVKLDNEANIPVCNDIDFDHDTIPDNVDACPESTDAEKIKGVKLQGANKGCPVDLDEDDIPDYKDECAGNTKRETTYGVDHLGCPVDNDKDGLPDHSDDDMDGDTVANAIDQCPRNITSEMAYGVNLKDKQLGCPLDSDGDKIPDFRDTCRNNSAFEISQGVDDKGCPADKDLDGVVDFKDQCLKSPAGVVMKGQGCEVTNMAMVQKPISSFFGDDKLSLSSEGNSYLADLLATTDLQWLKKVKLIGYTNSKNTAVMQNQLLTLADYFLQKKIPADKVEAIIIETDTKLEINTSAADKKPLPIKGTINAKKLNTFEFSIEQFVPKPAVPPTPEAAAPTNQPPR